MAATASVGAIGAGSVASAAGQYQAGRYQSDVADFNKHVAQIQAKDATRRGRQAERAHRVGVRRLIGAQRASLAAQGVVLDEGSALDIQLDTARLGELDALRIRNNAAREAWGFKVQAAGFASQADMYNKAAVGSAMNTLAQGAGEVGMTTYVLDKQGAWDK